MAGRLGMCLTGPKSLFHYWVVKFSVWRVEMIQALRECRLPRSALSALLTFVVFTLIAGLLLCRVTANFAGICSVGNCI